MQPPWLLVLFCGFACLTWSTDSERFWHTTVMFRFFGGFWGGALLDSLPACSFYVEWKTWILHCTKTPPSPCLQTLQKSSARGECYVVDSEVITSGIPYQDYFYTVHRYCLTSINKHKSRLRFVRSWRSPGLLFTLTRCHLEPRPSKQRKNWKNTRVYLCSSLHSIRRAPYWKHCWTRCCFTWWYCDW